MVQTKEVIEGWMVKHQHLQHRLGKVIIIYYITDWFVNSPPTECERLQTVPDGYTNCVADNHRYKLLGNGWTVDVIAHILREM